MTIHIPILGWDIFLGVAITQENVHSLGGEYLFDLITQKLIKGKMRLFGIRTTPR